MPIFSPGMRKPLRQARLYGYLVEREGKLYHPGGGSNPVCGKSFARRMVDNGWLVGKGDRYEITSEGMKAEEALEAGPHA